MTVCPTCGAKTESKNGWHQNCYRPKVGDFIIRRKDYDNPCVNVYIGNKKVSPYSYGAKRVFQVLDEFSDGQIKAKEFGYEEIWVFRAKEIRKANEKDVGYAVANKIKGEAHYSAGMGGTGTIIIDHVYGSAVSVQMTGGGGGDSGTGDAVDIKLKSEFSQK